jgi:RNA polymerase sigma-70 factor (ECF subfamily)
MSLAFFPAAALRAHGTAFASPTHRRPPRPQSGCGDVEENLPMTTPALIPPRPDSDEARVDFERSVLALLPELRCAALRFARCSADADDLLQETAMRAWQCRDQFEVGSSARAWLHRILVNTGIDRFRRRRREREVLARLPHEPTAPTHEQTAVEAGLRAVVCDGALGDEVASALDALRPEFRAVLVRVDLEDQSYREVADALGCPIGTVMSRLHRARRSLQRRLGPYAVSAGYIPSGGVRSALGEEPGTLAA